MSGLVIEKAEQAVGIMRELGIDAWLTFVRETTAVRDPVLSLIYGSGSLTWQSALLFSSTGERVAIVGHYETHAAEQAGVFDRVIGYHESLRTPLLDALMRWEPRHIAINYALDDVHADGLTYGMYPTLLDLLVGSPYRDRLVSAEELIGALRARKTGSEVARIRAACLKTESISSSTVSGTARA